MKQIKWFLQRLFRGFDNRYCWDLFSNLAYDIAPKLVEFKRQGVECHPSNFNSAEEWEKAIDEMIFAFKWFAGWRDKIEQYSLFKDDDNTNGYIQQQIKFETRAMNGLKLFAENFPALWN